VPHKVGAQDAAAVVPQATLLVDEMTSLDVQGLLVNIWGADFPGSSMRRKSISVTVCHRFPPGAPCPPPCTLVPDCCVPLGASLGEDNSAAVQRVCRGLLLHGAAVDILVTHGPVKGHLDGGAGCPSSPPSLVPPIHWGEAGAHRCWEVCPDGGTARRGGASALCRRGLRGGALAPGVWR
jgi:hypothetical protein